MSADTLAALRRGDLAGSRELRLSAGLDRLPAELFGLAETLEVLDLSGNRLPELPAEFARLTKLRVLFCSGNPMTRLPPALGALPALSQIGFRGCSLREIPAEALPPALRWATLTDNALTSLPPELGRRPRLQKLMLAGNRLRELPETLADASSLELIRIAANAFEMLPGWLAELPALSWIAWAGNPAERAAPRAPGTPIRWPTLSLGDLLGQGASGEVHRASWREGPEAAPSEIAVKTFKGAMTSDGLPDREIAAALVAGDHPHLIGALGQIEGHPDGRAALALPLVPADWRNLAGPPSLESCSRDVYDPTVRFTPAAAMRLLARIAAGLAHLHGRGVLHGDVYGHNILWDGRTGAASLGDFGAASTLPAGPDGVRWQRVEARAWGVLADEVLDRTPDFDGRAAVASLRDRCLGLVQADRPTLREVSAALESAL